MKRNPRVWPLSAADQGRVGVSRVLLVLLLAAGRAHGEDFDLFEARVRPVLVKRCFECHGGTGNVKSGLRLDTRDGLLAGGTRGPTIVPGDPGRSLLVNAVRHRHGELRMPPRETLSEDEIAGLEAWILAGAKDPRPGDGTPAAATDVEGVSLTRPPLLEPPREPPLPLVKLKTWPRSGLDAFVLAKLEERKLEPSPSADRRTFIRRVTQDLLGLPPSSEEVAAFESDDSPDAFEKLIDRLLASPRHAERWGRYWLDVARYSDTKGYVYGDREERRFLHSHVYRDWVIRAIDEDLPYDEFLLEQIAADQLLASGERRDPANLAAMGFLTLGQRFLGVIHDIIDDRIDVLMRGTQALTVSCARCHDHKFDPIPTTDYYSLYGVFLGSRERTVRIGDPPPAAAAAASPFEMELLKRRQALETTLEKKREALSERLRAKAGEYLAAVLDVENLPSEEFYSIRGPDDLNPVIVRQWQAYLFQAKKEARPAFLHWSELLEIPARDFAPRAADTVGRLAALAGAPDGRAPNVLVARSFEASPPRSRLDVAERYGELLAESRGRWKAALEAAAKEGRPPPQALPDPADEELRQVLHGPDSPAIVPRGPVTEIEWFFEEGSRVELGKLQSQIEAWLIDGPGAAPHAVILEDKAVQRNPRVFIRGNPSTRGDEVPRRFLEAIAGPGRPSFETGSGRMELARSIASSENPLTARVMVNRVWLHHFGAGLVATPSDFGSRSEPPSHPELLDWLALRFVEDGWSLKALHRRICLSSTYRQSSDDRPHPRGVDPENRLLWRMRRARLDFEAFRDTLLEVSGSLDGTRGGPPVDILSAPFSRRRTVYGFIDRQFFPGALRVFDVPSPDQHSPERHATTVPQQALFLMNSPFVIELARALAARPDVASVDGAPRRIARIHEILYQREATPREIEAGLSYISAAPETVEAPREPSPWRYGFGEYDDASRRLTSFTPLEHFTGSAWQGGPEWPGPEAGWARLTAKGGHAGNDARHAVVRRWVAPLDLRIKVRGTIRHEHPQGDGIEARIVSSRAGLLGTWVLHNKKEEAAIEPVDVKAGDTIDFVVSIGPSLGWDDFEWSPRIEAPGRDWKADRDFEGPPPRRLGAWESYAQALLLSNELLFVD
ncbi:MAG TPA: PSD1 and planctomycete cytochrome C domain-containing protein [Planctomycetota bacterium]|nr:PSD1 and planctomycete cytochrome C domain-containing protein [Planctomycetota bacterium]